LRKNPDFGEKDRFFLTIFCSVNVDSMAIIVNVRLGFHCRLRTANACGCFKICLKAIEN